VKVPGESRLAYVEREFGDGMSRDPQMNSTGVGRVKCKPLTDPVPNPMSGPTTGASSCFSDVVFAEYSFQQRCDRR